MKVGVSGLKAWVAVAVAVCGGFLLATEKAALAMEEVGSEAGSVTFNLGLLPLAETREAASLTLMLDKPLRVAEGTMPTLERLPERKASWDIVVTNIVPRRKPYRVEAVLVCDDGETRVACEFVRRPQRTFEERPPLPLWGFWTTVVAAIGCVVFFGAARRKTQHTLSAWTDVVLLTMTVGYVAYIVMPSEIFSNTLAVGGDIPAHHYLMRHLGESLRHGRLVSWAEGWWCGFPMYQYYFPLPYLVMNALSLAMPSAIAFKVGMVLGLLALPVTAYAAMCLLGLRRPVPALCAVATLPLIMDTGHSMWGVNVYSTMAGMISNSYSMALFPLALAAGVRCMDVAPRRRHAMLFIIVMLGLVLSHFFTSWIVAAVLGILWVAQIAPRLKGWKAGRLKGAWLFPVLGVIAMLLMAWWWLPLVATRAWSVDFGDQWDIRFWKQLPGILKWTLLPTVAIGVWAAIRRGAPVCAPSPAPVCASGRTHRSAPTGFALFGVLAVVSIALFYGGYGVSKVFVNCRLWPFIVYAFLMMATLAAGWLVQRARTPLPMLMVIVAAFLTWTWDGESYARNWARFDFGGLEALPQGYIVKEMADVLRDTPGRLAYDMHPGHELLGSSRIFEAMPVLANKPIIEGGIINSALGSLGAYSIQGQVSDEPAGWPLKVSPLAFNPAVGLQRLTGMGVRHFVAHSPRMQRFLDGHPDWACLGRWEAWSLYEFGGDTPPLPRHGNVAQYPRHTLAVTAVPDVQDAIVAWFADNTLAPPTILVETDDCPSHLEVAIVPMTYFPNWKVKGGQGPFLLSNGFMGVIPESPDCRLVWGRTLPDRLGLALSFLGLALLWIINRRYGLNRR
ncbi:MAG: hypothetical protein FWF84_07805 [Kiritimatiellaeota bacterium]|nr:hypothetical protein [Kiritimatiellota bacterium]